MENEMSVIIKNVKLSMNVLRDLLTVRQIPVFGDVTWRAWSPNVHTCDFWLWDYLNSKSFFKEIETFADLKS